MRISLGVTAFAVLFALLPEGRAADDLPPSWAFAANPPNALPSAPDDGTIHHVSNSTVGMTLAQVKDGFNVPDWHPDNHPAAPDIVSHGRKPAVIACGYCHLPNGQGRPENAALAGLPAAYIVEQVAAFRSGVRRSPLPDLVPPKLMAGIAKAVTDEEVTAAAAYFSALDYKPWIRVVETASVPRTHVAGYMLVVEPGPKELIGQRIVETPENLADTELRDSASGFVAYVPPGSIGRGEVLARTGGGRTTPCGVCHGVDLRGLGPVPPLAGRSPSYLVRQLYEIQHGQRAGNWTPLMQGVVRDLTPADLVDLAAYAASRRP